MKRRLVSAVLAVAGIALLFAPNSAFGAGPAVPVPAVTGPIPVTEDSYPFLATDIDLSKYGYVEEEYFIEGDAYRYSTTGGPEVTGTRLETGGPNDDGTYPFKTRIVVRRPANPADANGTVLAEWYNVTAFRDIEWNWFGDPEFMLDNGYTFVGVSAQNVGMTGLYAFDNPRYGGLTVNGGGTVPTGKIDPGCVDFVTVPDVRCPTHDSDALSYDIFGAAINAVKDNRTGGDPLPGFAPDTVIASGESQSCSRLSSHYNKIEPLQDIVDAYLLTVCGSQLRADRPEKAIRIISETENRTQRTEVNFPDNGSLRHWEVAGGSHLPRMAWDRVADVLNRDFLPITVGCQKFPLSLVQWPFTVNRAIKGLEDWVSDDTDAPPIAPRGVYSDPSTLVRDQYGIAEGGIRYPELTVPTGTNDGVNSPGTGGNPLFNGFCGLLGSNTLFERSTLDSLYTDHADYVNQYSDAVDAFVATDFMLAEDAPRLKQFARDFPELRPTAPMKSGSKTVRKSFALSWVGTEAPQTTFALQRKVAKSGVQGSWSPVKANVTGRSTTLKREPEGAHVYRVRSSTVIPANNVAEARTTTTPFSVSSVEIKVDRTGPKAPKLVVKGRKISRNTYSGPVRVTVVGKADPKLADGSAGSGLDPRTVPKTMKIRRTKTVTVRTKDKAGNKSKPTRLRIVIR
jgi:hypothetical protein